MICCGGFLFISLEIARKPFVIDYAVFGVSVYLYHDLIPNSLLAQIPQYTSFTTHIIA